MQVECAGEAGLARALTAAVLVHNHAAQRRDARWDPDRVIHREGQLTRLGGFVSYPIVRRIRQRKDIIRGLLGGKTGNEQREREYGVTHGWRGM